MTPRKKKIVHKTMFLKCFAFWFAPGLSCWIRVFFFVEKGIGKCILELGNSLVHM
jgi:hypothetical protein